MLRVITLEALYDTRWCYPYETLRSVLYNGTVVIYTLVEIEKNETEFGSDAAVLLKCGQAFEFLIFLILLEDVLLKTNILSKYL